MSSCQSSQCDHQAEPAQDEAQLQEQLGRIRHKLLVMSGKGGVGKSSVAAYLAVGLAKQGHRVGLLDVDLHGPSIPHILGISGMFGIDEENKCLIPHSYNEHLKVVSMECLLEDKDSAVIWRGPLKHGVIKQFISEVRWGELDYLIIDSPPGTGDEPLSVAQTIPDARAIIVTTPQEVALADVRKSINFCRNVHMPILGLVENMSGYICPHCNEEAPLFGKGGGIKTARKMQVDHLGSLPFDPRVVESSNLGICFLERENDSPFVRAFDNLVAEVARRCAAAPPVQDKSGEKRAVPSDNHNFRVAIPLAEGTLTNHFGHCEQFAIVDVRGGQIQKKEVVTPPPHEPGLLPRWLGERQVNLIIAGGMGHRALELFNAQDIDVITGAPNLEPEELIRQYVTGSLETGANVCDH